MPPQLALLLWFVLLVVLLRFDPSSNSKVSGAVWLAVIWMFILGSRLPSQWLGQSGGGPQALEEGNPVDRTISLLLIVVAVAVLRSRSFKWGDFLTRNWALALYLTFTLFSVFWSDFMFVAFKRWFRDLGNYLMVLVVLSDPHYLDAVRALLRRLAYLFVPLSIVLIKYFPAMAKQYEFWTGGATFSGAATSKNTLGVMCLISGLFFFWDTLIRWPERRKPRVKKVIVLNVVFLAMTFWLLSLSNSATSRVCVVLGCAVIFAARSRWSQRHPVFLKTMVPACFVVYLLLSLVFNVTGQLAGTVGRDPTLTDRTKIWAMLLRLHTNPLIGTGYESFWLGSRLDWIWQHGGFGYINEAHNGYLEVYLNIGLIGLLVLAILVIACYRNIWSRGSSQFTSLALSLWFVMLFHSVTEADFRSGVLWVTFLLAGIALRQRKQKSTSPMLLDGEPANLPHAFT